MIYIYLSFFFFLLLDVNNIITTIKTASNPNIVPIINGRLFLASAFHQLYIYSLLIL